MVANLCDQDISLTSLFNENDKMNIEKKARFSNDSFEMIFKWFSVSPWVPWGTFLNSTSV